jgi:hypothetical protein
MKVPQHKIFSEVQVSYNRKFGIFIENNSVNFIRWYESFVLKVIRLGFKFLIYQILIIHYL